MLLASELRRIYTRRESAQRAPIITVLRIILVVVCFFAAITRRDEAIYQG